MQNNIESLFVPYQIALDMKSIGFDEPCFSYYLEDGTRIPASYSWEGTVYPSNADLLPEWCTAPTFSQAFKWFRKQYKMDSVIIRSFSMTNSYHYNIIIDQDYGNDLQSTSIPNRTYEQAELECLKKLIEIIKEKL
jgi:hypothetical protein